ncbi:MAG: hypothetical protein RLN81_14085 [Balneolaceae bacterium]
MGTILNKIVFGTLFLLLSWNGFDGLIINILHNSVSTVDIRELEENQDYDARYLEILNGITTNGLIYYETDYYSSIDVVYPLISIQQKHNLQNGDSISIRVLVRINGQSRDCLTDFECLPTDSISVKGIVKKGIENISLNNSQSFETELVSISKNVILIVPNEEPIIWYWNLAMFLGGGIFGFAILKSFFRKASSTKDYWEKITEKEEYKKKV